MKEITKVHESITKDYESLFYSMKDQSKKVFTLHFRSYIPFPPVSISHESPAFMLY